MSEQPIMLGNRYRLDEIIGRGGMAEVWRAWDTRLGRDVAVKRLRVDLATDPTFQARFQREAQSAAGLNHPNIVAVHDTGAERDPATGVEVPYIVMELVQGTTLRDLLRDGRQILPTRALEFTAGVLDALAYAHRRGIVHRDIKPANVMLTTSGRIKVMDFGIARAVADTSATMTQTAAVIGTAQYLSPEQARGETVDTRSDLYSVGCLLYELLTSRPPFIGDSPVSVAYQHVREQPVPPSRIDPELTPAMDTVTLTALAKNPNERYQTAEAMRDDIQRLLDGQPPLGAAAQPVVGDSTRILTDRPAPGARPRRGFTEAYPVPVTPATTGETAVMDDADAGDADPYDDEIMLPDGAENEPPNRRMFALVAALIGLLVVLLAAGGIIVARFMRPGPEPTTTTVPSVMGYSEMDAKTYLSTFHLVTETRTKAGPDETKGQVIEQIPPAGDTVDMGSTVIIYINLGPEMGTIPENLIGMTEAEARKALQLAGFRHILPAVTADPGTYEPPELKVGQVLSVQPPSGEYPLDGDIKIVLASGKSPVPDLKCQPLEIAIQLAKKAGFTVSQATPLATTDCPAGTVASQTPQMGAYELRGNPIFVRVAEAPPPPPTTTSEPPPTDTPT